MAEHRILFVCLGNICRSPMAEGIFRHLAYCAGRLDEFVIDSAGTGRWHAGERPDPRAQQATLRRGIDISGLRARQIEERDFREFDLIIAMDNSNLATLHRMAPAGSQQKLRRLLDYLPFDGVYEVPDPYYGGDEGFDTVLDLIDAASAELIMAIADAPGAIPVSAPAAMSSNG